MYAGFIIFLHPGNPHHCPESFDNRGDKQIHRLVNEGSENPKESQAKGLPSTLTPPVRVDAETGIVSELRWRVVFIAIML